MIEKKQWKKKQFETFLVSDNATYKVDEAVQKWLDKMREKYDFIEFISDDISCSNSNIRFKNINIYGYKY